MKLFLDTEFICGFSRTIFGKRRQFIDLISIGLVDDTGREYYAVSKDFNPADADDWVKENVLMPIFRGFYKPNLSNLHGDPEYSNSRMSEVLRQVGRHNREIANDIRKFVYAPAVAMGDGMSRADVDIEYWLKENSFEFYAYFADYDWVLFCSLFGGMLDLPLGFPQYCMDLKQMMQERGLSKDWKRKNHPDPEGEHNAGVDAKWNKGLYEKILATSAVPA